MKKENIEKWMHKNKGKLGVAIAIIIIFCVGFGIYSPKSVDKAVAVRAVNGIKGKSEDKKEADNEPEGEKTAAASKKQGTNTKKDNDSKNVNQNKENGKINNDGQIESKTEIPVNDVMQQGNGSDSAVPSTDETDDTVNKPSSNSNVDDMNASNGNTDIPEEKQEEEVYQPKWVVDQEAWTETISEPVYESREYSVCNGCGADITGNETAHMKEHMMNGENGSWRSEWTDVQVGTNTYEEYHEEVGHWEYTRRNE